MRCWQTVLAAMVLRCRKHRPGGSGRVLQQPCVARAIADRLTSRTAGKSCPHWFAAAKIGSNAAVFANSGCCSRLACNFLVLLLLSKPALKTKTSVPATALVRKAPSSSSRQDCSGLAPQRSAGQKPRRPALYQCHRTPPQGPQTTPQGPNHTSVFILGHQGRGRPCLTPRRSKPKEPKRAANFIERAARRHNPLIR